MKNNLFEISNVINPEFQTLLIIISRCTVATDGEWNAKKKEFERIEDVIVSADPDLLTVFEKHHDSFHRPFTVCLNYINPELTIYRLAKCMYLICLDLRMILITLPLTYANLVHDNVPTYLYLYKL